MKCNLFVSGVVALSLMAPVAAGAQGIVGGAANGAEKGKEEAGPVGAVVGGIIGGVAGGIAGLLGIEQRTDFRDYVARQHHPSDIYRASVAVGNVLPEQGIQYYEVPARYGVPGYRYAIVNDTTVLVDPRTRKIVEVEN